MLNRVETVWRLLKSVDLRHWLRATSIGLWAFIELYCSYLIDV